MADTKVYEPETIQENPYPSQQGVVSFDVSDPGSSSSGQYEPSRVQNQAVPTKRIATELLSNQLNTRSRKILGEFQFTRQGAIQIGDYKEGESGDIRISPDGIVARNSVGNETFALDGETGSAVFAGEVQAGTLISGAVAVGDANILIDGATRRMIFYDENGIPSIIIGNA